MSATSKTLEVMARRFRALGLSTAEARRGANEALHARQAEGMAVVPVEPSGDVITAGCLALGGAAAREALMAAMLSGDRHAVAHTKMRIRWHAMLAAAP